MVAVVAEDRGGGVFLSFLWPLPPAREGRTIVPLYSREVDGGSLLLSDIKGFTRWRQRRRRRRRSNTFCASLFLSSLSTPFLLPITGYRRGRRGESALLFIRGFDGREGRITVYQRGRGPTGKIGYCKKSCIFDFWRIADICMFRHCQDRDFGWKAFWKTFLHFQSGD